MNRFRPKVSIIIPVYNGADYLREAIDSALAQTYENIEVIVVNDGSTDSGETEKIALSYKNRIRYFYKENGGVASALNLGIRKMSGEYFSWLSHDDFYFPEKIQMQIKLMQEIKETIILYTDFNYIDKDSRLLFDSGLNTKRLIQLNRNSFRYELIKSDITNGCTLLIPKRCFEKVGLFSEELKTSQDYDMWFRLSKYYNFLFIPKVLVSSRLHEEQGSYKIKEFDGEKNNYYINCLKSLTKSDILKMTGENKIEIAYLKLGLIYRDSNLTQAAKYAFNLCKDNFFYNQSLERLEINPYTIKKQLESISDDIKNKKVIIFGTGKGGKLLLRELIDLNISVTYFVDNDSSRWGKQIGDYLILSPITLLEKDNNTVVIVSSMYYTEISEQLKKMNWVEDVDFYSASGLKKVKRKKNEY